MEVDERASNSRLAHLSEEEELALAEIESCTESLEKALERLGYLRRDQLLKIRSSVWAIHTEVLSATECLFPKKPDESSLSTDQPCT